MIHMLSRPFMKCDETSIESFCCWLLHHEAPALVVEILHDDTKALILLPHHPQRDSTWFYDTAGLTRSYSILRYQLVSWLVTERIERIECLQHANDRYDRYDRYDSYISYCYKDVIPAGQTLRPRGTFFEMEIWWNMSCPDVESSELTESPRWITDSHYLSFVSLSWNILEHCQTLPNIDLLKLLLANEVFRRHLNLSAATVSCSTSHQTDPNGIPTVSSLLRSLAESNST